MGGKNSAPPPPDYTPIANASREAAAEANALARQQFEWAQKAYAENKGITDQVVEQYLKTSAENAKNAEADRRRYEEIFQPLEDQLVAEANEFASPERRAMEMGRAEAEVAQQFDAARKNAQRNLEGFGINPGSTRFAALDLGARTQQAAAQAAAANQAGLQVDAIGRALRSDAINIGRGMPAQAMAGWGLSNQSGAGAVNSGLATTGSGSSTMGNPTQWSAIAANNIGNWSNALTSGYNAQMKQYEADQKSSSGIGSLLGMGLGALMSPIPGGSIMGSMMGKLFAEDGGAIPDPTATPGGAIPASASPTGGGAIDDVPAQLTAGEFVLPKDVTNWYGERHLQQMIEKARKEKQGATAKPTVGPAPAVANPTFVSRPPGGGIPLQ